MQPTPEQLKKLERVAKVLDGGDVELLKQLDDLEARMAEGITLLEKTTDKKITKLEDKIVDDALGVLDSRTQFLLNKIDAVPTSAAVWGGITGTLSGQTDLQNALNAKQDVLIADTDYLTPSTANTTYEPLKGLDDNYVTDAEKTNIGNLDASAYEPLSTFEPAKGVDDNYVTDAEKTNIGNLDTAAYEASTAFAPALGPADNYLSDTEQSKLSGIADGATLNATDTFLKNRANHTGTQDHTTISDYDTELAGTENVTSFTPTADYHPATKKYVDDNGGGASPLTTKGDLFTFSTVDARLPIGTDDQVLVADSAEVTGMKWADFTDGYSYFPVWAEESATIAAGATEYSFGNGDETPLTSGIPIGVDCELFACGGEAEASTGVNLEVIKNGTSVAETGVFSSNTVTTLGTPVSFSAGDLVNFRTKAVTSSGASCRPVAWFRVAVRGQKGDKGDAGASGDIVWQGTWSAGTYNENDTVEYNGSSYVCVVTSTTDTPSVGSSDWDLVAEKGDTGPSGSVMPYAHLIPSTTQNMGGANGTVHYVDWDGTPINLDTGFTHSTSTNPSRIQVDADGRYEIKANVQATQGGSARTTLMSGLRVNGTTANVRGRQRNYSRGSAYGDLGVCLCTEIDLTNGDYIEMSVTVDDSDATYTINMINAESEFIIRKIA